MNSLASKTVTGYTRGKAFPLVVVEVAPGRWAESGTAAAYLEMAEAAKLERVELHITSAWRSFEEQEKTYLERADPTVRAAKGQAAPPGWSNHQSGRALDIETHMTVSMFAAGVRTSTYRWLELNARKFGFRRTVAAEPWHFEHVGTEEVRS